MKLTIKRTKFFIKMKNFVNLFTKYLDTNKNKMILPILKRQNDNLI